MPYIIIFTVWHKKNDIFFLCHTDVILNKMERTLESIRSLIADDLRSTDQFIISQLESNIPLIKQVIEYVLTCGGKRIRPMILLLGARALAHRGQEHIDLAAVIEL